jgi:hypothetical protein
MSRVEENMDIMAFLNDEKMNKPNGTFEEMTVWSLGTIATLLADISKSLAIIADSMSKREDGEQNE